MSQFSALTSGGQSKWSFAAYKHLFNTRVTRTPSLPLQSQALKTWEIAPGEIAMAPPAFYLPDQLARVTGWAEALFYPPEHRRLLLQVPDRS